VIGIPAPRFIDIELRHQNCLNPSLHRPFSSTNRFAASMASLFCSSQVCRSCAFRSVSRLSSSVRDRLIFRALACRRRSLLILKFVACFLADLVILIPRCALYAHIVTPERIEGNAVIKPKSKPATKTPRSPRKTKKTQNYQGFLGALSFACPWCLRVKKLLHYLNSTVFTSITAANSLVRFNQQIKETTYGQP